MTTNKTIKQILMPDDDCLKLPTEHCRSCLSDTEYYYYSGMNCCDHSKWLDQTTKKIQALIIDELENALKSSGGGEWRRRIIVRIAEYKEVSDE